MINLLIVDDEAPLLRNLGNYLSSFGDEFAVSTAATGEEALSCLESEAGVDVLLTDVRLPGIDGVELVRRASVRQPQLIVLVMTAFPSRDIRRAVTSLGALRYLEKPLDLKQLRSVLLEAAASRNGWSGSVGGLDLFDFTQLFALSGKSTALSVSWGDHTGHMVFKNGALVHASTDDLDGEVAFYAMTRWRGGTFREETTERGTLHLARNISAPTNNLIMEAARLRDEEARQDPDEGLSSSDEDDVFDALSSAGLTPGVIQRSDDKEERVMALKDHLADLEDVQGFQGAAVFTAQGEMLEGIAKGKLDIKTVGMFANNALLNAQKATDQMGVGRGNMVQIRAPQALVLMRCLNEATDFAATKEGKAHFHTVVVLEPEGNIGMAGMLLEKAVAKIAEELR